MKASLMVPHCHEPWLLQQQLQQRRQQQPRQPQQQQQQHPKAPAPPPDDKEALHNSLGAVAEAQGVSDPDELSSMLSALRHLKKDGQYFDPKHVRRACSMYQAAIMQGIADKRDFMAAAALYGVLRDDDITNAKELRLAIAMYSALGEEGMNGL